MFIYVGGVPGTGKTTIISETIGLAQKYGFKMKEAGGVPILCRLAGVETVNELRALPEKTRQKLRSKMEEELRDIDSQDPETIRIQDGHFVFFDYACKEYGTRQAQPWDRERILALSVITASPQVVLRRRLQDVIKRPDRRRDINFLIKEQELETNTALLQAKTIDAPLRFIQSEENKVLAASEILFRFCFYQMLRRKKLHS